jgi:NADH dehydrogenase (ubiquinone) 1 alpha subcomplex subunit 5
MNRVMKSTKSATTLMIKKRLMKMNEEGDLIGIAKTWSGSASASSASASYSTTAQTDYEQEERRKEKMKTTTGLVGLAVLNDPINEYAKICKKVLEKIQFVPEHAAYRTIVEETYRHRREVCLSGKSVSEIECAIEAGQIEELMKQAEDELTLIPKMREWKPWEFEHEIVIERAENPRGITKN